MDWVSIAVDIAHISLTISQMRVFPSYPLIFPGMENQAEKGGILSTTKIFINYYLRVFLTRRKNTRLCRFFYMGTVWAG